MTRDYGPPMNEIAIYATTITALEDLCFRDPSAAVPDYPHVPFQSPTKWSLPQYYVYLEISSQQVRHAIWGLQLAAGDVRRRGLWPVIGRYFWQGQFAGRLDFANKNHPLPPGEENDSTSKQQRNASFGTETDTTAKMNSANSIANTTAINIFFDGARLTIVPTYRGEPLSPRAVFGTAIDIMVLGFEYGLGTHCLRLQRSGMLIIGESDAAGEPLLKYKSLIRAMAMLLPWMIVMDRWGEIDVEIQRDTVVVGKVRIQKRTRSGASLLGMRSV